MYSEYVFAATKNTEDFSPVFSVKHRFLLQQDVAECRFLFLQTALQCPQISNPLQVQHGWIVLPEHVRNFLRNLPVSALLPACSRMFQQFSTCLVPACVQALRFRWCKLPDTEWLLVFSVPDGPAHNRTDRFLCIRSQHISAGSCRIFACRGMRVMG